MPDISGCTEQVSVFRHADGHYSVWTEILIEAPAGEVWAVLTDFPAMAHWSSSLKGVTGELRHGGLVQSHFFAMGRVWVADHVFILEEGRQFGWSDPLTGAFTGVRDHHLFLVEQIGPDLTRFIQSDEFTGENATQHGVTLAKVGLDSYPLFNVQLAGELRRRRGTGQRRPLA